MGVESKDFGDDGFVGDAVVEHLVDEVAGGFGEAGDLAVARVGFAAGEEADVVQELVELACGTAGVALDDF